MIACGLLDEIRFNCYEVLRDYEVASLAKIKFSWNKRFSSKIAFCHFEKTSNLPFVAHIEFSPSLWPELPKKLQLEVTTHEALHVVAPILHYSKHGVFDDCGHGELWSRLMREKGYHPRPLIEIDDEILINIGWRVKGNCSCLDGCAIKKGIAKKIENGFSYTCRICNSLIGV